MRQDVEMIRGTSEPFELSIMNKESGSMYILGSGESLIFALKRHPKDVDPVLVKTFAAGDTEGLYTLEFAPADTAELDCAKYFYDVGLQSGEDFVNVIPCSVFEIKANITKWGDTA